MPSHTPASALIKLYSIDGAPWGWQTWKDRTRIRRGLFPPDDDFLPPGMTRQDTIDVQRYFKAYQDLKTEDDKITFATKTRGAPAYPGRATWNLFIQKNWNRWGVHTAVIEELKDWDIHPYDIVLRERLKDGWPSSDTYISMVLDTLGMRLFGHDGFLEGTNVLRSDLRVLLKIFVQRSWCRIRTHIGKVKIRAVTVEGTALQAFKDLEDGNPTRAKVNSAIRAVAKWKECAEILNTPESIKVAEDMLDDLRDIMETLGAKVASKMAKKTKEPLKISTQALKSLASEEDVTEILNAYHQYFESNIDEGDEMPISDSLAPEIQISLIDDPSKGDFGMEVERKMNPKQLAKSLGFKNYLPFSFNVYRHKFGTSAWEDENLFNFPEEQYLPAFIDYLKLHWHQLAGVHSIIRSIFLEEPDNTHPTGVLIGDEVGLGKTAQSIAFIAFLNQAIYMQEKGLRVPPILTARPYLGGDETIPSLPHLILCPGTIVAQWVSELKTLFLPWSVDIFTYDSRVDSAWFWGPEGPIRTSKHKGHNRIVVATHSAIFAEFKKLHNPIQRKDSRPWLIPSTAPSKTVEGTIFAQDFLSIIVDEAHHMRNPGNKHVSTLRLLRQARIRVIMTATPLHTAPKDIASLGRLVGIPHFSEEASHVEEKDDGSALRRAKKFDDEGDTLLREQLKIVRRLQGRCVGHFLRRTVASTNWEGKVLLPLPEPKEIIGLLQLTDREAAIIDERAKAAKDAIESSSKRIQTKKFYLEYRLAVGYAKEDIAGLNPEFKTLEDWEPLKSTKMDVCARICAHYLQHDHMDDVYFEDGKPVFPVFPEIPGERLPKRRRIIIYSEFPSMAPLLQNVLRLYGVESLAINGEIPFHQRDKRVKDLYDDEHPARVLLFSAVAAVGLNLAIADVVIFFDQPWSAQDERQVRGRAHRQPQKKVVKVIHLLAINSADTVMYSVARGKENMFDAFVNKELADELRSLLQGAVPDDPSENPGMEDDEPGSKKQTKKSKRRIKQVLASGNEDAAPTPATDVDSSMNMSDGDGLNLSIQLLDEGSMIAESTAPDNEKTVAKNSRRRIKHILPGGNEVDGPDPAIDDNSNINISDGDGLSLSVHSSDGMYFISESISSNGIVLDSLSPSYPDTSAENDLVNSLQQTSVGPDSHFDGQDNRVARERDTTPPSESMQRPLAKRARHGTISEETRSNIAAVEDLPEPVSRSNVYDVPKLSSNGLSTTRIPPSKTFPVQVQRRSDQPIMQVQSQSPISTQLSLRGATQMSSVVSSRQAETAAPAREQRRANPLHQKPLKPTQAERQNFLTPSNHSPSSSREPPARNSPSAHAPSSKTPMQRHRSEAQQSAQQVPLQGVSSNQQISRSRGAAQPSAILPPQPASASNSRRREPNQLTSAESAITRPRQQGSTAVPPKAALKFNHHQNRPKDGK